jgi:autotransporter-associated beta strand protein
MRAIFWKFFSRKARKASRPRRTYRPTIEALEGRTLLSTDVWSGFGVDRNWTDGANWQAGVSPGAGDDLMFPSGAAQTTATNDFAANTTFRSITMNDAYTLQGNALVLTAGISTSASATVSFSQITLGAAQTFTSETTGNLTVKSAVVLNGHPLTMDGGSPSGNAGGGSLSGVVSGYGGMVKTGSGFWLVSGANSYTGLTIVHDGGLGAESAGALGSPADGTLVYSGATLSFFGPPNGPPLVSAEPLMVNGPGIPGINGGPGNGCLDINGGGATLTGPVTMGSDCTFTGFLNFGTLQGPLNTNGHTLTLGGTLEINLLGPVSGAGTVILAAKFLSGETSIPGAVTVLSGTLSPGVSGTQPGVLGAGSASFQPGTTYHVNLNGTGTGAFSQLQSSGDVNLNNSTLDVALNFTPNPGDAFPIITSNGAILGTFQGLPDGATLTIKGQNFIIHYVSSGGPGHLAPSSQVILELPGGSGGGGGGGGGAGVGFRPLQRGQKVFVTAADAGGGPDVKVFDAATDNLLSEFNAYGSGFTGGVRVAVGDINGDGYPDIVTAAGPGGGPNITVWDGRTGAMMAGPLGSFFAYGAGFTGGVYVAVGDVNGDGAADIICGADRGGGPNVTVFSGRDGSMLLSFFPYAAGFTGGVRVAAGAVTGAGPADIITGAGPGGGPNVTVYQYANGQAQPLQSYFAFGSGFTAGIYVAAGDVNGDGKADVIVGAGAGGGPDVAVFSGADGSLLANFFPYAVGFTGGVRVGAALNGGTAVALTVPGPGGGPDVGTYDGQTGAALDHFFAYDPRFSGGLYVAGTSR